MAKYLLGNAGAIVNSSPVFITEPWGRPDQPRYLNQALLLQTDKSPLQLLKITQKIEKTLGRSNKHHNSARVIDIDILFYDEIVMHAKNLVIPHPRLHLRNFTLQPLLQLNAGYTHPVLKKTIEQLAKDTVDTGKVSIFKRKEK